MNQTVTAYQKNEVVRMAVKEVKKRGQELEKKRKM